MEDRPMRSLMSTVGRPQLLTPISPSLPTSMPPVCESILPLPMTPPDLDEQPTTALNAAAISTAIHVISTERTALAHLERLYDTNPVAQEGFVSAVSRISKAILNGGKLVISGVGKSGKIGGKIVATMNSFGIRSAFLHPTEALHGDLGLVGPVSQTDCECVSNRVLRANRRPRMTSSFSLPSRAGPPSSYPSSAISHALRP